MKVGIYGLGVVGGALARFFETHTQHKVMKRDPGLSLNDDFVGVDAIFVCVPVPTKGFKQDLSIVETILDVHKATSVPIFLRSTVLPGTADRLSQDHLVTIYSCPEFLTERSADADTARLPILAGLGSERVINELFKFSHQIYYMKNAECEMAKYAHNCFGAMKVTYFNGIERACRMADLEYERVLKGVLASGHINRPHTQVPGPDGERGYGGKCFPKDVEAFVGYLKSDIFGKMLLDAHCANRFYRGLKSADQLPKGELDL